MNKKREEETEVVIYKSNIATVSNEQVSEFKKGKLMLLNILYQITL